MARPREFRIADVVERAETVFRARGYEAASLPELLDAMQITRGSLYKAFESKKDVFLQVLARYESMQIDPAVQRLITPQVPDGRRRISGVFKSLMHDVAAGDRRGCLLCTTLSGAAMSDPEIAAVVQTGLRRIRDGMEQALAASPLHAGLPVSKRLVLANTLLTQYVGLNALARSCLPLGIVEQSAQAVDALLLSQKQL